MEELIKITRDEILGALKCYMDIGKKFKKLTTLILETKEPLKAMGIEVKVFKNGKEIK